MISIKEIFQQEREWQGEVEMSQAEIDEQWQWMNKKAGDSKLVFIESLIHTCTLEQHQIDAIEAEVNIMTNQRATAIIDMLKNNQQQTVKDFLKRIQRNETAQH